MNVLLERNLPESFYFSKELGITDTDYEALVARVVSTLSPEMRKEFWELSTLEQEIDYMNRFHKRMLGVLGRPTDDKIIQILTQFRIRADYRLAKGAINILRKLHSKYQLGVLTNAMPSRRHYELRLDGLDQLLDVIVISREVGAFKPTPEIYRTAISKSGYRAEEILFVDDKVSYLEGAIKAGITNVVLMTKGSKPRGYVSISNLSELVEILSLTPDIST